jgi:hypothetical protein
VDITFGPIHTRSHRNNAALSWLSSLVDYDANCLSSRWHIRITRNFHISRIYCGSNINTPTNSQEDDSTTTFKPHLVPPGEIKKTKAKHAVKHKKKEQAVGKHAKVAAENTKKKAKLTKERIRKEK